MVPSFLAARNFSHFSLVSSSLLGKLTLSVDITDYKDWAEKRYSARLLTTYKGVILTFPSVAAYRLDNVLQYQSQQEKQHQADSTTKKHQALAQSLKKDQSKRTKSIILEFPDGITCNNKFFNGTPNDSYTLALTHEMQRRDMEGYPLFVRCAMCNETGTCACMVEETDGSRSSKPCMGKMFQLIHYYVCSMGIDQGVEETGDKNRPDKDVEETSKKLQKMGFGL